MAQSQVFNNTTYSIPVQGDQRWGPSVTRYLTALGTYAISPAGGLYTLTADLNLGDNFGILARYFSTGDANPASAGHVRLANTNTIRWRNFANAGNLALAVDSSDRLTFAGTPIQPLIALNDNQFYIGDASNLPVAHALTGAITTTNTGVTALSSDYVTNAMVNSAANIQYSKLNLSGSILNSDIYSAAAIAYSKLNLSGSIVNADVNASAAIAYSKLALTGSILNADLAGSIAYSKLVLTNSVVNADIASAAAIAYSKLALTGSIVNADVNASAAIAYSKLALSNSVVNADISTSAAIAYSKLALTGAILNADLAGSIAYSKLATLSASIVPVTTAGGLITSSSTTATELGYLSGVTSAIQTQLNAKQATGNYVTALTGDVTASGPGSVAATLATVNSNVGSFTSANITVNAKGLITAASNGGGGGTVTSVTGTANQITSTGGTTPVLAIASPLTLPGAMTSGGAIAMGANKITGLANGTAATDAAAFGQLKIFQTVSATFSASNSTTSVTAVATGITASITPTSASSKILVIAAPGFLQSNSASGVGMNMSLYRSTTNLAGSTNSMANILSSGAGVIQYTPPVLIYLDSPATTSSTTYTVNHWVGSNTLTMFTGSTGALSSIILIEVQ